MGNSKLDHISHWCASKTNGRRVFWLIVFSFTTIYLVQVTCNHYFFRTYAYDYAIYNNAVWDYSHFRINSNPIFTPPLITFLQDHISFTLIMILPVYWIINPIFGTYSLLIIEVLFIILGGIGCYKLIFLISKNSFLSLLALLHYYMLHGHFAALSCDYHDVVIGASMITWFIYFFIKEKYFLSTMVFLFVILSKENMPLWLIFILFVLVIYQRKRRNAVIFGSTLIFISISYFIIVFTILIPYFEDPAKPHWAFYYKAFGDTPGEVLKCFVTQPLGSFVKIFYNHTGQEIGNWVKAEYFIYLLLFGAWLLFRRPLLLLLIFPVLAQKMLMDSPWRWSLNCYSSIEIVSILSFTVFYVIAKMKNEGAKQLIAVIVTLMCVIATIHAFGNRHTLWRDSSKENVLNPRMYTSELNIKALNDALSMIPPQASVSATNTLVPHLAYREKIYVFPQVRDADYIVLLEDEKQFPGKHDKYLALRDNYLGNPLWSLIFKGEHLLILKKEDF